MPSDQEQGDEGRGNQKAGLAESTNPVTSSSGIAKSGITVMAMAPNLR